MSLDFTESHDTCLINCHKPQNHVAVSSLDTPLAFNYGLCQNSHQRQTISTNKRQVSYTVFNSRPVGELKTALCGLRWSTASTF